MDLTDFKPKSDSVTVTLKHPNTGEPLSYDDGKEFNITLHASHTKEFKESQQKNIDIWLNNSQKKNKKNPTLMEIEQATSEHYARITTSWDLLYNKAKPKLSVEKAKEIYMEYFWIRDQIQEALDDSVDFTTV